MIGGHHRDHGLRLNRVIDLLKIIKSDLTLLGLLLDNDPVEQILWYSETVSVHHGVLLCIVEDNSLSTLMELKADETRIFPSILEVPTGNCKVTGL